MDEEELLQLINSLPLSVQQSMMQYMMAGGDPNMGGTAPFGAGPMNTGRTGTQLQGPLGVSPYDPMSAGAAYAYTPQLDAKGREQPFDLGTAQQNLNLIQDQQGNLFNNAFTMQAGAGAYAPGTFDPLPQAPGEYDMLVQSAMGYGPTSYQGFIADRIAKGEAPDVALSNFWAVANDPSNPASASLLASLPPKYVQQENPMDPSQPPRMVQVEGGDMQKPQEFVQQLTEAQMKQAPGAPEYGATAQDYIDKGIPFPTERYGQGQYSTEATVPGYAEAQSAYQASQDKVKSLRATPAQAQAQVSQLLKKPQYGPQVGERGAAPEPAKTGSLRGTAGISAQPAPSPQSAPAAPKSNAVSRSAMTKRVDMNTTNQRNQAVKARDEAYFAANTPEAVYADTLNKLLNKKGRTPTQDVLMQRQLTNYMMGAYGPRG
jgi:hypothetical protein